MFARYASAVTSGTLMTLTLLYVMQTLISLQPGAITEPRIRIPVNFVMQKIIDTPVQKEELVHKKEDLTKTIQPPPRLSYTGNAEPIHVPFSKAVPPTGGQEIDFSLSDGSLVNLVRVGPIYPAKALARDLEGHVVVEFDVDESGRVMNVVVIESSHPVFEKAAIKAAQRFKFKPRVVDGQALISTGIQNIFRFTIED